VSGASLAPVVDGWEVLIEETLDSDALQRFGRGRGQLFTVASQAMVTVGDPLDIAGQGWALADLARHLGKADEAQIARELARPLLHEATRSAGAATGGLWVP
jgi:phytoene synthase